MSLTEEQRAGLNVAINEADLLGFEVDADRRIASATLRVLTLPEIGPSPDDRRVQFLFRPVGRLAASLREGRWDDRSAPITPFALGELLSVVRSFGALPVYSWEFIDVHGEALARWGDRLSLDWSSGADGRSHSLTLFQESGNRILELCAWFDELEIRDSQRQVVSIDEFIAAGKRWWDAFNSGDERTEGFGMVRG